MDWSRLDYLLLLQLTLQVIRVVRSAHLPVEYLRIDAIDHVFVLREAVTGV